MWLLVIAAAVLLVIYFRYIKKSNLTVIDIIIYPIKSCGGIHLTSVQVDEYGMLYDRQWVMITPDNKIVTQRQNPNLAKLQPTLIEQNSILVQVELSFDGKKFTFETKKIGEIIEFECMEVQCEGLDEGHSVTEFLKEIFQNDYRLIRVIKHRQINKHPDYQGLVSDQHQTNFTDAAQFLVVSEASYLKTKASVPGTLKDDLEIGCFRGNIIVSGCRPFQEDSWARFTIGEIDFEGIGRCPRCRVTTVNQKTLQFHGNFEPVNTLRKINGNGTKGYLGMHCIRHTCGEMRIGQQVIVKQTRKFPDI